MKKSSAEDLAKLETSEIEKLFKEILSQRWKEEYYTRHGLEKISPCPGVGPLTKDGAQDKIIHPPGADHFALWAKNGEPFMYTMGPYKMEDTTFAELLAFCKKNGLQFRMAGRGLYFPGVACLIAITKKP